MCVGYNNAELCASMGKAGNGGLDVKACDTAGLNLKVQD